MSMDFKVGFSFASVLGFLKKLYNCWTVKIRSVLPVPMDSLILGPSESLSTELLWGLQNLKMHFK